MPETFLVFGFIFFMDWVAFGNDHGM